MAHKCVKCGRPISGKYHWKGELYGKECWKKFALPELLAERAAKDAEDAEYEFLSTQCLIKVLEAKNLSRISNQFKLEFIPSVIEQFHTKGYLTSRQWDIALDCLNGRDSDNLQIAYYAAGLQGAEYTKGVTGYSVDEIIKKAKKWSK